MTYDAAYFIAKFEGIPEECWTTGNYIESDGRCCAYGHCGAREDKEDGKEPTALMKLFGRTSVSSINDGRDPRYQQPTPKQRVIAALKDLL